MRDQPTGEQLLETARAVLRDELIPALPADRRHAALMVANAVAIAARQLQNGDTGDLLEIEALEHLLGLPPSASNRSAFELRDVLLDHNRLLCVWIRSGRFDAGPMHDEARTHLLHQARRRVEESNPKYLRG
jgi:hypothetical protein